MADHERHAGAAGGGDDGAALLHRRRDRLLDHDVKAARDAGERQIVMKVGRRRNGHGLDAAVDQRVEIREHRTAQIAPDKLSLRAVGIDHPDQLTPAISDNTRAWLLPMTPTPITPIFKGPPLIRPGHRSPGLPRLRLPISP